MFSSSVESDLLDAVAGFSLCENNFLLLLLLNRQEFPVKSLWGWKAEFVQFSSPFEISVQSQGLIADPAGHDLLCLLSSSIVGVSRENHFKYRGERETISSSNAATPQTNLSTRLESLPGIERERESFCTFLQIQGFTVAINSTDSKMSKTHSHHKQHVITITCSWQTRRKTCCSLSEMHGKSTNADISWPCATSKSSQFS